MARTKDEARQIDGEWTGTPIPVDGGTVTPVVRVQGLLGRGPQDGDRQDAGEYVYGWLRLQPVRATVVDASGRETVVRTDDLNAGIRRNMAIAGVLVAAASAVVIFVRKLVR